MSALSSAATVDPAKRAIIALSAAEIEKFLPGELASRLWALLPSAR